MLNTTSDADFQIKFVESVINAIKHRKAGMLEQLLQFFSRYQPRVGIDSVTNDPWIELGIKEDTRLSTQTMTTLIAYLQEHRVPMSIAIDEFQQISNYPRTTMDATLREWIQADLPIHWILSGSQRHLLMELVSTPSKPLYRSLEMMQLHHIAYESYHQFITQQFAAGEKDISIDQVHDVLNWTERYTYYTQVFCNRLYGNYQGDVKDSHVQEVKQKILLEQEMVILSLSKMMTSNQYKTWRGIAKEGEVSTVRSKQFTAKYDVSSSTANLALHYLLDAQLVHDTPTDQGTIYSVYDVFFKRYLQGLK
jgi:hypothetical protein